jgi:hypothetical protein
MVNGNIIVWFGNYEKEGTWIWQAHYQKEYASLRHWY